MNRKYYRFLGNADGSGRPYGVVIKCYTDEEYDCFKQLYRLSEIKGETDNKRKIIILSDNSWRYKTATLADIAKQLSEPSFGFIPSR